MNDEPSNQGPPVLIVHTAKHAPSWLPWVTYALVVTNTWLGDTGNNYFLYVVSAIAIGMTYMFFNAYHALVRLYNEVRVDAAIRQCQKEPPVTPQIPSGSKVPHVHDTTDVDTSGLRSTSSDLLDRYKTALEWINDKAILIGEARDCAWRALEQDEMDKTNAKEAERESQSV